MRTPQPDPYAAERAAVWRNRWAYWRGHPQETLFHATAIAMAAALLLAVLSGAIESISAALHALFDTYLTATQLTLAVAGAWAHHRARREQRQRWSQDWLATQPLSSGLRRRLRWQSFARRLLVQLGALLAALWLARASMTTAVGAVMLLTCSGLVGDLLADVTWQSGSRKQARELPRRIDGHGSLRRWQQVESAAVLAPRRLAWMLLLILLVPRGPALMILPALGLIVLGILAHAWQRCLAVIPAADRFLEAQPVAASVWLRQALAWPLLWLGLGMAGLSGLAWLIGSTALLGLSLLVLPSLALLQLACTAAERRAPRRAALLFLVQMSLLLAVWQAMPVVGVPWWLIQMLWLWRRARR